MDIRKLQRAIVDGLEDVKAQDIVVFNTEHLSPLFERVIIASGTSNRQTKALASSVREAVKSQGMPVLGMEGGDNGEWIIVDCGAAVAHIMQPAIREYYRLEEIWGGKSVKIKLGNDGPKRLVKAESAEDDEDDEPIAKLTPARKAAARKTAGKPAVKAPAAKKAPARKAAAGKTAAAKSPAAKKAAPERKIVVGKKPAPAKKAAPARNAAAKTAGRTVAKAAPRKTGART